MRPAPHLYGIADFWRRTPHLLLYPRVLLSVGPCCGLLCRRSFPITPGLYRFVMQVSKGRRSASTSVTVAVLAAASPQVLINWVTSSLEQAHLQDREVCAGLITGFVVEGSSRREALQRRATAEGTAEGLEQKGYSKGASSHFLVSSAGSAW